MSEKIIKKINVKIGVGGGVDAYIPELDENGEEIEPEKDETGKAQQNDSSGGEKQSY